MLAHHGMAKGESRYSWTVDFAARRKAAKAERQPLLDKATEARAAVVDLKEQLRELRRAAAKPSKIDAVEAEIAEKQKLTKELEGKAAEIDAASFDLKAVNPHATVKTDDRTPEQIIDNIAAQGKIVSDALERLKGLMGK
jgi:type I restriction enzyme M protein